MAPSLRTVSILMLLAGISMGVFAGTLMADDPEAPTGPHPASAATEQRALHYQRMYGLDEVQTDAVRQELVRYQRKLYDRFRTLWSENQQDFETLRAETEQRIDGILRDAGAAPK